MSIRETEQFIFGTDERRVRARACTQASAPLSSFYRRGFQNANDRRAKLITTVCNNTLNYLSPDWVWTAILRAIICSDLLLLVFFLRLLLLWRKEKEQPQKQTTHKKTPTHPNQKTTKPQTVKPL